MNVVRLTLCGLLGVFLVLGAGCSAMGERHAGAVRVFEGRGVGLPAADAATPDQQAMTARRAAYFRALADLAGKVYGTHIAQEAKVVNMQFAGENLQTGVSGLLAGVEVVSNEYDPQTRMATAVVRVALDREDRRPDRFRPGLNSPDGRSAR